VRVILPVVVLAFFFLTGSFAVAQSPNGSITGMLFDPDGKTVPGAEIIVVNDLTGVKYLSSTNGEGIYTVANLPPGPYRIQVSKVGFKTIIKPDIILNVQDALSLNFTLPIGATSVTVTVEGGAPMINTTDGSVSTVVDSKFVEDTPLNGRSFQGLILLTPGVVTNSPQQHASVGSNGQFSVNGQRTESNYYTVDGVSANFGSTAGGVGTSSGSGSLPNSTTLGTTQGLISLDALEEFRIQSSSYSAEFGRNPGGQFSFATRSGTNQWHGTAFDYLRNDAFDANDWFNNYYRQKEPPLRQNDFGGTLGGPVEVPGLYHGRGRTFFYFSYEGLRLVQPQASSVSYVPTSDLRNSAPAALQPVLKGFPLPNCPGGVPNCSIDFGNGLGEFVGTWSNPSSIDAVSIKIDHTLKHNHKFFFHFSNTSSDSKEKTGGNFQSPSVESTNSIVAKTYTGGLSSLFTRRIGNDFRVNYSTSDAHTASIPVGFGGAQPVNLAELQGLSASQAAVVEIDLQLPGSAGYVPSLRQSVATGRRKQWNVVDTVSVQEGRHVMKFGVDYRHLTSAGEYQNPYVEYEFASAGSLQANTADFAFAQAIATARPYFQNFSAFVQDEWRIGSRLTLSSGLRWEVNPPPGASKGNLPYTVQGNSLATLTLAPQGMALWQTGLHNLAPRLGLAYVLRDSVNFETVVRAGGGVFFDTGQQFGAVGYSGPGFSASNVFFRSLSFPGPLGEVDPPIANPPSPPYGTTYAFPRHLQLPYAYQANVSVQQSLGKSQAVSLSYVGGFGRKLLELNQVLASLVNPQFGGYLLSFQNGLTSDYNSLQVQYQRRMSRGLQALASFTQSRCLDYGSENNSLGYQRGNCDFDVRSNLAGALSYDFESYRQSRWARIALNSWGLDARVTARSAFPVTLTGQPFVNPATGQFQYLGLDRVADQPVYVHGSKYPGGRSINVNAFAYAPATELGDAPRNFVRGFGAWQADLAVRKEFPLNERVKLQFRAETFNAFNHPNFGALNASFAPGSTTFGVATATLAQSLGALSPLYQMGGPRSMQFALKLAF
jgi:carboxypeptidase family protein